MQGIKEKKPLWFWRCIKITLTWYPNVRKLFGKILKVVEQEDLASSVMGWWIPTLKRRIMKLRGKQRLFKLFSAIHTTIKVFLLYFSPIWMLHSLPNVMIERDSSKAYFSLTSVNIWVFKIDEWEKLFPAFLTTFHC